MTEKDLYDISEVCEMLDTTSRTLRFYEDKGIITSTNDGFSSRRKYTEEQINHIRNVLVLRTLGLSVKKISELLKNQIDLKDAIVSKRAEIISSIDKRIREINLLNEAMSVIDAGKSIFDMNLSQSIGVDSDEINIAEECTNAILTCEYEKLYVHLSERMKKYMPPEVFETARKEIEVPLGDFISVDGAEADPQFWNKIYSFVRYSNLGLKITYVFYNKKIDGLWLSYYDPEIVR